MVGFVTGFAAGVIFVSSIILFEIVKEMSSEDASLPNTLDPDYEAWGV